MATLSLNLNLKASAALIVMGGRCRRYCMWPAALA